MSAAWKIFSNGRKQSMECYLATLHKSLTDLSQFNHVHVVLGNESCDLDSAVSALTYALYLNKVTKETRTLVLPLLNIPHSQYRIHTELLYFLHKLGVKSDNLIFLDHLDLESVAKSGQLQLTLVDHNVLTARLAACESSVVNVIDHHVRERSDRDGVTVKLDLVGSCCTLVAEELLNDPDYEVDEVVAELLFGTILVDTVNRSPEAGKITPRDNAVLEKLQSLLPAVDGDQLFASIQAAKLDMSGLTNMDILDKDLKMVSGTDMVIAMSSVAMDMQELLSRPNFQDDLQKFCESKSADVSVIMTLITNEAGQPARQMAVYSSNRIYRDQIADVLDNSIEIDLDLEPQFPPFENISLFTQGNHEATRKSVMLTLGAFLNGDRSPEVASKEFATDSSDSMATEGFTSFSNITETDTPNDDVFRTSQNSTEIQSVSQTAKARLDFSGNEEEKFANIFGAKIGSDDFNGTHTQKASQILTSGQRSSANSSNLFDFLTSGSSSELVDPFSSVEENIGAESSPGVSGMGLMDQDNASHKIENVEEKNGNLQDLGNSDIISTATTNINPFLETFPENSDIRENKGEASVNVMDDFDPFKSDQIEQSYISYDPFGPDSSLHNPFGPNETTDSTTNPFRPNGTTDTTMNPFGPNGTTDSTINPFGPNEITHAPEANPFGSNTTANDSASNPFGSSLVDIVNTAGDIAGEFEGIGQLSDSDPFGSHVHPTQLTNSNNNPYMPNVPTENPFSSTGAADIQKNDPFGLNVNEAEFVSSYDNPFGPVSLDTRVETKNGSVAEQLMPSLLQQQHDPFQLLNDPFQPLAGRDHLMAGRAHNQPLEYGESPTSLSPDDDEQARMEYLGIGTEGGTRAKARKSISLIVEFDRESDNENLAELDEADFYDRVPTPETEKSGNNSPFINPNFTVPFENIRSGRSSESGSGYPSVATPPNSVTEDRLGNLPKDHDLPSFNNAEMVERIRKKKRSLVGGEESTGSCEIGLVSTPYTPQNSFRDDFQKQTHDLDLLNFDDDNMTARVTEKRNSLGIFSPVDLDNLNANKPFDDSPNDRNDSYLNDLDNKAAACADWLPTESVPCAPANSFAERSGGYMSGELVTEADLYSKLTCLAGRHETEDLGLLDFSQNGKTSHAQTGAQTVSEINNDSSVDNVNQSSLHDSANLQLNLVSENADMKTVEQSALRAAMELFSRKLTIDIMHEAVDTFPDMKNKALAECVTTEVLMGGNSTWTDQGSGDSGICSNESPQQGLPRSPRSPRSPRHLRGNEYQYSVETEYLPNMDPLHGNLNIVTSPSTTSHTIETDANKEVVESESFRKVSGQERELSADSDDFFGASLTDGACDETNIVTRIIEENLLSSQLSVEKDANQLHEVKDNQSNNASGLVDIYDLNIEKESESMTEDSPEEPELGEAATDTSKAIPDIPSVTEDVPSLQATEDIMMPVAQTEKNVEDNVGELTEDNDRQMTENKASEADSCITSSMIGYTKDSRPIGLLVTDNPDGRQADKDDIMEVDANSVSPDTSSSFASTTDSESELITVRENVELDVAHRSPDSDEKKYEEFESIAEENGIVRPDEYDTNKANNTNKDNGTHEHVQDTSEKFEEGTETVQQASGISILDSNKEPCNITGLNLVDVSMTESTVTVETISPVDTPNDEHVSGFYEVNSDKRMQDDTDVKAMSESMFSTNLGDNETGFYEINPEISSMYQSAATSDSQSSPETSNNEIVSGFYKVTADSVSSDINSKETVGIYDSQAPIINVADFDDKDEKDSSEDEDNTGSYDVNAKLQGTVLQNIEMGHAFSPIESPNDEIISLNYQINPLITDHDLDNSDNDESDNADDLFTNYITDSRYVDSNLRHDEKFIEMAETMVTEAITGALDTVQEMQFKKNEQFIISEIASAIEDESESSDSDASSTTTEGSYRIQHSLDDSPVMSPEMDSFMKEHVKQSRTMNNETLVEDTREDVESIETPSESLETFTREPVECNVIVEGEFISKQETVEKETGDRIVINATDECTVNEKIDMTNRSETVFDAKEEPEIAPADNDEIENVKDDKIDQQIKRDEKEMFDTPLENSAEETDISIKESSSDVKIEEEPAFQSQESVIPGIVVSYEQTEEKESGTDSDPDLVTKIENVEKTEKHELKMERKQTKVRTTQAYETRKEIFYTSAGRMSISIDSVLDTPEAGNQEYTGPEEDIIHEAVEPEDDDEDDGDDDVKPVDNETSISKPKTVKPSHRSHGKMRDMEDTQEWHEDPIPGMTAQEEGSSDSESESDSDSEYTKPVRPDTLLQGNRRKKRIIAGSNMVRRDSTDDLVEGVDDLPTPDDLETPDDMEGEELEWEDDTPITPIETKKFAEYREEEMEREQRENTQFRKVEIAGKDYRVDMHVIEPYKKVLSHGGYYGDGLNAIILFSGCYLPDRGRRDYQYVMDNLFLYVISTLELLVAEDYMIVYFHGATPRRQMPSFGWLKRCYQMIDRRLRKNLKGLLMVHPTLWLKTVVMMTKPFISSKFSSKLRFVKTLHELGKIVPMEYIYVPDPVTQYDTRLKQHRTSSSSSTPMSPTSPS